MSKATGFPPLSSPTARVLILGSMPGAASLKARQYYAHPHNQFWPIMNELFGAGPELGFAARVRKLVSQKVAVWDVLKHCKRTGSLDSSIVRTSEVANDFARFFRHHPHIRAVFFNGAKAEQLFQRHVPPLLKEPLASLRFERLPPRHAQVQAAIGLYQYRLPSTSPAHAGRSFRHKLRAWRRIKEFL